MVSSLFIELGSIIILAAIIGGIIRALKQPLIIGYILTGIIVSPYFLNFIDSKEIIQTMSHIGIALLLFIVGLSLNLNMLKDVGKISLITGLGQVLFTSIFGFILAKSLGFAMIEAMYIAVALTFSSTIIIMKLLSDKGDVDSLYGRISIGFLLVQDLIVVFALIVITAISQNGENLGSVVLITIIKIIGFIILVLLFSRFILDKIITYVARSQEYLFHFAIAWCLSLSIMFHLLNFSIEIGALLAGITLASTPYKFEITSRMKPLRDFFLILFFVLLGSQMVFSDVSVYFWEIIIFSLFILIGNPLIVIVLMGMMNYSRKNAFLAGLTVAQISEFSLILIGMGISVGHINQEILSIVTVVGLITITGSSYMILYSHKIYPYLSKMLKIFEKRGNKIDDLKRHLNHGGQPKIILFGYNRIGFDLLKSMKKMKKEFQIIDYNPRTVIKLTKEGYDCKFGDASDLELLQELNLHDTRMIISTIPDTETNLLLIKEIRSINHDCIVIVMSHKIDEALELYKVGASYVILPHFLGGQYVSTMIENYKFDTQSFLKEKVEHLEYLKNKKQLGHEHPRHEH